jgi:excinuclease UvrABC helicase subunit UvrB
LIYIIISGKILLAMEFKLKTKISPKGDQPNAIRKLFDGLKKGFKK